MAIQSPTKPHFFRPLLPGFNSHLSIPETFFSKHLQGRNERKTTAKLRSDASDNVWEVKLDDGGRRLTGGWKEFVTAHNFRVGDVIVFRHEGDLVFHVAALGPSCCEIHYTSSHYIDVDDDDEDDNFDIKPKKKRVKKNPWREEDEDSSSLDNSCFTTNVSRWSIYNDRMYVPRSFVRSNGLSKTYCNVVLLNEKGSLWKLCLDHDKSGVHTYLRHGWRSFCNDNGLNRGRYRFRMVCNSGTGTIVIRLCQAEYRPGVESWLDRSCFVGYVSSSSLRYDRQYLPREFVRSNGLNKECCEIFLKNEHGGKWNLDLRHNKSHKFTVIKRGWRSFCEANGMKVRDNFRFKVVRTGGNPVLCLCPAGTHTRFVESSEGSSVNSLSTGSSSGEESSESEESEETSRDEISVKEESEEESFKVKRRKHWSRQGASSSLSQNRFVTLCMTLSSFKTNRMRLPVHFTRANGINKPGTINLLGQDGVTHVVPLLKDNRHGRLKLGRDWKGFFQAHGVKIGESVELELAWDNDATPVLKFCTKL